jgi:hypothetical protein
VAIDCRANDVLSVEEDREVTSEGGSPIVLRGVVVFNAK